MVSQLTNRRPPKNKEDAQGERRLGVASDVGFDQRGHEREGQHPHEHEQSAPRALAKSFDARAPPRKEPARAQGQCRSARENDGGNLERAVEVHYKQGFEHRPLLHEKGFEATEHHAVVENDEQRARQRQEAGDEGARIDRGIVEKDVPKHGHRVFVFVDRHRIAVGHVLDRHVHILVAEDGAGKVGIHLLREDAHDHGNEEDGERNEEVAPRIVESHRDVVLERAYHLAPAVGTLAVDMLMEVAGDAFEVVGDGTFGEVRLAKPSRPTHRDRSLPSLRD